MATKKTPPLFEYSPRYLKIRDGRGLAGVFKRWGEHRAIDKCLAAIAGDKIKWVCDMPCGPGRLFGYWNKRGFAVIGVDLSESMAAAAKIRHGVLGLDGMVCRGDAFKFSPPKKPDLIACVRFLYYFDTAERVALLKHLGKQTQRYLLLQYHATRTMRGKRNAGRGGSRRYFSDADIRGDLKKAGLALLCIENISQFSDRVYVLAESSKKSPKKSPKK